MTISEEIGLWPSEFDEPDAERLALADETDLGDFEPANETDPADLATAIISHQLRIGLKSGTRYYINDNSSFRAPHTDQYQARVALYNRAGARVYLGPFRDKGGSTGYGTLLHTEAVWDSSRVTYRSLVLWRSVNGGSVWTNWVTGT